MPKDVNKDEQIGFHKGALTTLAKEREEMLKMHIKGLKDLDVDLQKESKKKIEAILESKIDTISIPRGFCNNKVIDEARRAGYKTVFVSQKTSALTSPCLERVAVKSNWTLERFIQALNGETPLSEKRIERLKGVIKSIFGDRGYNKIRKFLVRKK